MLSAQTWNSEIIKQLKEETKQALLIDEQSLVFFSQDFGKLIQSYPSAVYIPHDLYSLQKVIAFAYKHKLPITIRGNGLSQNGQSLAVSGGLVISMQHFTQVLEIVDDTIWVEANASWADLLNVSLKQNKAPFVLPYNCNLSVAGVLSAGGIGASSFKYGSVNAHVAALEVIDGKGIKHIVDKTMPLCKACLSGQGQFAVITKACIELKPVLPQIKTFCLVYSSQEQWFEDVDKIKDKVDYMELFCSPSIQGAKIKGDKRVPMAQWFYGLHLFVEYETLEPDLNDVIAHLKPWQIINTQHESISSFFLRHDSRFEVMKMLGQWDLIHPWYECFVGASVLQKYLSELLQRLPLHYASLVHVVPVTKQKAAFLMMPEEECIYSIMILNPGVPEVFKESCIQAIAELDACFIPNGGKRYLSGFLGTNLSQDYWSNHFSNQYSSWIKWKKEFDPAGIFTSWLYSAEDHNVN